MDIHTLVHMANRIGEFFQAMPDPNEARQEIAQHLHKFWAPRMRGELLVHIDTTQGQDLLPLVRQAVAEHRTLLVPRGS